MMRYQRLSSPDVLPLSNGRKPSLRTCKEEDAEEAGRIANYSALEAKSLRLRHGSGSTNPSPTRDNHFPHISFSSDSPPVQSDSRSPISSVSASATPVKAHSHHQIDGVGQSGGGDVLLRWGQRKRSRAPRTEVRAVTTAPVEGDELSAHSRSAVRVQRRTLAAAAMPPPCSSFGKGAYLRSCTPVRAATGSLVNNLLHHFAMVRAAEDRSGGGVARSEKRSPPEKPQRACANGAADASAMNPEPKKLHAEPEATVAPVAATEKLSLDRLEWPRIYVSLSRKEKEDDFLAMKGTKLPQRPKKRAKNIDRTLQYCFPGMWLSDLTRGRYEVREKKCVKKKRRGLKGMESSDSE
ncbi:hypothetical protein Cni_G29371 [Canna indica]|uniref:DUF1639 family protein n=1 Tax=Canna indica TaxID=4628 RepID=A0AAQ3QT76_9LILI|nr:hypothetical protein Cni_G29371 [Canna indica]